MTLKSLQPDCYRCSHNSPNTKAKLPTHVEIDAKRYGFERDSVILLEQIRTIDKQRLTDKITHLDDEMMEKVDEALQVSLALIDFNMVILGCSVGSNFLCSIFINVIMKKD